MVDEEWRALKQVNVETEYEGLGSEILPLRIRSKEVLQFTGELREGKAI